VQCFTNRYSYSPRLNSIANYEKNEQVQQTFLNVKQ